MEGGGTEPAVEPPVPTENAVRDEAGHDEHDEPAGTEDGGAHTPEARGGGAGTATAVLNALSTLEVVRRLLAVVSPEAQCRPRLPLMVSSLYSCIKYGCLVPVG